MSLPDRSVRHDLQRVVALPPLVLLGSSLLLILAGFGQAQPERLPLPALITFGALFGDAIARSLHRTRTRGVAWLVVGLVLSAGTALAIGSVRDLIPVGATLVVAAGLRVLPERRAAMFGPMTVYVAATVLANYTLDAFLPVGPWFLVNVGTLFFGVTFTQRDRVHRFGRGPVYAMIAAAAVANVVAALAVSTPLRYVAVSFLAIVASEAADTEVFQRLLRRRWLTRVLASNAVSAPLDTLIFTVLAFAGAPWATFAWMVQVIVTDVLVKYLSGLGTALLLLRDRMSDDTGRGGPADDRNAADDASIPASRERDVQGSLPATLR